MKNVFAFFLSFIRAQVFFSFFCWLLLLPYKLDFYIMMMTKTCVSRMVWYVNFFYFFSCCLERIFIERLLIFFFISFHFTLCFFSEGVSHRNIIYIYTRFEEMCWHILCMSRNRFFPVLLHSGNRDEVMFDTKMQALQTFHYCGNDLSDEIAVNPKVAWLKRVSKKCYV